MDSDPKLRRLYLLFNKRYFNGELPDDTVLMWAPCADASAKTDSIDDGDGKPVQFVISVDPCLTSLVRFTKLILLHEMIHIKLWPHKRLTDHGARFDEEKQHLLSFRAVRNLI